MNHRHRKILHALFDHPVSANIDIKDVETMLREFGAEVAVRGGDRIAVSLNGHTAAFPRTRHSISKDEVVRLRHFLTMCGIDPAAYSA
ncbi:MAG: hypothetical protein FJX67_01005 [Alphaproteobacteria bacterium]|nr:hypothetical protein [Alphaproteobacteria bacterium]